MNSLSFQSISPHPSITLIHLSEKESVWFKSLPPLFWELFLKILNTQTLSFSGMDDFIGKLFWINLAYPHQQDRFYLYQSLVDANVDFCFKSASEKTILMTLFPGSRQESEQDVALLRLLLQQKMLKNSIQEDTSSNLVSALLHQTLQSDWIQSFKLILQQSPENHLIPYMLHDFCQNKTHHYERMQALVENTKVDINQQNKLGNTPLHLLFNIQNYFDLDWEMCLKIRYLLEHGAEPSLNIRNLEGQTPMETILAEENRITFERWFLNLRLKSSPHSNHSKSRL